MFEEVARRLSIFSQDLNEIINRKKEDPDKLPSRKTLEPSVRVYKSEEEIVRIKQIEEQDKDVAFVINVIGDIFK
jgi:hypothetical protein